MKTTAISIALATVLLTTSALATAQPDDRGRGGPGNSQGAPRGDGHGPGDHRGGPDHGNGFRGGNERGHYSPQPGHGYAHGYGYGRPDPAPMRWGRGDRVPPPYRGRSYVIDDWRGHRLHAPPRGYEWISTGADYFLIGIATGIVLDSVFLR